jgi:hypothetical protein
MNCTCQKARRREFCRKQLNSNLPSNMPVNMPSRGEEQKRFLENIMSAVEATVFTFRKVLRRHLPTWCYENPRERAEHITDTPKLNAWAGVLGEQVIGHP